MQVAGRFIQCQNPPHQLAALHRLDLGEDWLRAVLWQNGARLFTIPG